MRRRLGLLLALSLALPAQAADTFSAQVENDFFSPNNRDRHYTQGLRFSLLPDPSQGDEGAIRRFARGLVGEERSTSIGYDFGQSIFTPQNLQTDQPIRNDRPYAGWLYAGLTVLVEDREPASPSEPQLNELDTFAAEAGMVGRASLAHAVQRGFHRALFEGEDPKGWRNQLKSEPGLLLSYDHRWRGLTPQWGWLGIQADLTPDVGASIGNVADTASIGLTLRIGADLPADYGPPRIRPGQGGSDFLRTPRETGQSFGWYVFAGIEGRAVAHNILLDGNSFATSQSVPKKNFVADLQGGIAFILGDWRLTGTEVIRSPEFHGQKGTDAFGSISLSVAF